MMKQERNPMWLNLSLLFWYAFSYTVKKVLLIPTQSSTEDKDGDENGKECDVAQSVATDELSAVLMDNILVCILLHNEEGYATPNTVIN